MAFRWSLPRNPRKIRRFFREFVPKNPAKFDFFLWDLSEVLLRRQTPLDQQKGVQISVPLKMKMSPKILAKGTIIVPQWSNPISQTLPEHWAVALSWTKYMQNYDKKSHRKQDSEDFAVGTFY